MDELASDHETASVKPVLMVAGMLVAALCGAVITVHPAPQPGRQQRKAPPVEVVVIQSPRAAARQHGLTLTPNARLAGSRSGSGVDWV
jgi:hypothetical protein